MARILIRQSVYEPHGSGRDGLRCSSKRRSTYALEVWAHHVRMAKLRFDKE